MCIRDRSTSDNIVIETSTSEINLTSEMDVQLNPISQTDEANTPVSAEITKIDTSIPAMPVSKLDGTAEMMKILLNKFDSFDKKLDEQNSEIKEIQSRFNDKFDSLDIKFNELKNEIKLGHNHLIKKCDKLITCLLYTSRCV